MQGGDIRTVRVNGGEDGAITTTTTVTAFELSLGGSSPYTSADKTE